MSREDKRKQEREEKRKVKRQNKTIGDLQKWLKSWTPEQKRLFSAVVEEEVNKNDKLTESTLDSCYIASMIDNLDLGLEKYIKVCKDANNYMLEVKEVFEKEGEGYFMKVNNKEMRIQIKKEAKAMLKSNPQENTLNISRELAKEYKLPIKDLHIIVAEAREEIKAEQKVIPSHTEGKLQAALTNEGEHGLETIPISKEGSKLKKCIIDAEEIYSGKFKIKTIELQGKYGTYSKSQEGIKTNQITFKDIKDLEQYKTGIRAEIEGEKDALKEQIEELQEKLTKINEDSKKEYRIIAEIEEIFKL
jgi:hypothetical protein